MESSHEIAQKFSECVSLCKELLSQDKTLRSCLVDLETHRYFKSLYSKPAVTPPLPVKKPQPLPPSPIKKEPAPVKQVAQNTTESKPTAPPAQKTELSTLLPRPFAKKADAFLQDIEEQCKRVAPQLKIHETPDSDQEAKNRINEWKQLYPVSAIISLSGESTFLHNVSMAIHERLGASKIYPPTEATLLELHILAEHNHLQAVIVAYDPQTATKASDFMANFVARETSQKYEPLSYRGTLFHTKVLDLIVTKALTESPQEKARLWKTICRIVKP